MVHKLIFHPCISHFVRFLSTVAGRDKLVRLFQFYSRFRIWHLTRHEHLILSKERWVVFMSRLALTRKVLRAGRSVEQIQTATKAASASPSGVDHDCFLHYVSVLRHFLLAAYLVLDNATILDTLGLHPWKGSRRITLKAARFWFSAVVCGLCTQLYSFYRMRQYRKDKDGMDTKADGHCKHAIDKFQLLSNLCDLGISSSAAGLTRINEGLIGICGVISSGVGIYRQVVPTS